MEELRKFGNVFIREERRSSLVESNLPCFEEGKRLAAKWTPLFIQLKEAAGRQEFFFFNKILNIYDVIRALT